MIFTGSETLLLLAQTEALFNHGALAAAGAAAIAIPIAIHLLSRLRRQPVRWAAMRFLQEAFRRHRQRLRIEQLLLLLVRCLLVLLLGFALAGPLVGGIARRLTPGTQGRVVCIILDDALSSQADIGGRARFDHLRDTALTLLENLGPSDRVGVWRAAVPAEVLISPSAVDVASARQALQSLKPRFSRADLVGALRLVADVVKDDDVVRAGEPVKVIVLSDFSATALDTDKPLPSAVAELHQRAAMWVVAPQPAAANVQITSLAPRRRTILATGVGAASVAVDLKLRRFAGDDNATMTATALRLVDPVSGETVSSIRREHRWAAGQNEATLNVQLPIEEGASLSPGVSGRMLAIEASIEHAGDADAIEADNHAYTTVEWRQRITVGIVDDPTDIVAGADGRFTPRDWISLALSPRSDEVTASPVELIALNAAQLDAVATATLDAVFVTRPDRLTDEGIAALSAMARRGGLVWITPPRGAASAVWASAIAEQLKLNARIGMNIEESPAADQPWQLQIDSAAPQALSMLGADWEALLRPVQVTRTLVIEDVDPSSVWLSLRGPEGGAWMTVHPSGRGAIVFLGSAIDPDWSNLPTRPLFVPLLHETLRGVIGGSTTQDVTSGQDPDLDGSWREAQRLVRAGGGAATSLVHDDRGTRPAHRLVKPGVYLAEPASRGLQLAVNPDFPGGDTRALDPQRVMTYLSAQRLDEASPDALLAEQADRTDIGWPLLWAVLALLLLETALAKWFSHAHRGQSGLKLNMPGDAAA